MAYNELIKNFDNIRSYMREFYIYGFKSRNEYDAKSARSYDNERRRVESWLGDYMGFKQTTDGKNVFLSVDSRIIHHNPLYKAWKTKSFTDGDITLYFAIFDILYNEEVEKSLAELVVEIDELLDSRLTFDESTLRKKLKEYAEAGIIQMEKSGRKVLYRRSADIDMSELNEVLDFFSEVAPCGVIGSFLQDRQAEHEAIFSFKHHYITQAIDSDIIAQIFAAMQEKKYITIDNVSARNNTANTIRLVPLKIYISAQNGRQHLLALHEQANRLNAYRLDYIAKVRIEDEVCQKFDILRQELEKLEAHMWGVNCRWNINRTEHVEFELKVEKDEYFIIQRLEREKRCGVVTKTDENHYKYEAEVFDTNEMIPWIRTFISRITRLYFSNSTAESKFRNDLDEMYKMYGISGGSDDI